MSGCKHVWTELDARFGWYGPHDKHYHACYCCTAILVGPGRYCDGDHSNHSTHEEARDD